MHWDCTFLCCISPWVLKKNIWIWCYWTLCPVIKTGSIKVRKKSDLRNISHPKSSHLFSFLPLGWNYCTGCDKTWFKVSALGLTTRFWDVSAVSPFWCWTIWNVLHGEVSEHTGDNVWILYAKPCPCAGCTPSRSSFFLLLFPSKLSWWWEQKMWFLDISTLCSVHTKCFCCKGQSAGQHSLCSLCLTGAPAALTCSGCRGAVISILRGFIFSIPLPVKHL